MNREVLKDILEKHLLWFNLDLNGEKADLSGADLCGADLQGANLSGADLCGASLCGTNLSYANLPYADLSGADLRGADLSGADLRGAGLSGANLDESIWDLRTSFYSLQCPESGSYTAYKKAGGKIVELIIPADAKRSSATSRTCRASKAIVISITDEKGNSCGNQVRSDSNYNFIYTVGETVEVDDFDENRWHEFSTGIHHFITRDEAVKYNGTLIKSLEQMELV